MFPKSADQEAINQGPAPAEPPIFSRAIQTFWNFAERGDIFSRALFLWTIVFGIDLLVYMVLTQIILPAEIAQDTYLSSLQLDFLREVVAFYLIAALLVYAALFILKYAQRHLTDNILRIAILLACLNYVHICHFFGGIFVLIAPIFLLITVTNVSVFIGPRLGKFTLYLSVALYFGTIAAQNWGYLGAMSVILPPVTVDQIFTNPTLVLTFTIILGGVMLVFESLVIEIVTAITRKTEQTQNLNLQLESSNRKLEEMDGIKNDFLSMVSHDLRSPLVGILAYAYMVRDNQNLTVSQQHNYLDIVIEQGNRLNRLVDDLLDMQKFEAGKMEIECGEIGLVDLVRQAVETFKGAADQKQIELRESLPSDSLMVSGNHDRLLQVMTNLLSNALKFTPRQGLIEVKVEVDEAKERPTAKVAVRDNGPGIDPAMQGRVFEKFQRGSVLVQGTGLGLALVREIVEAHGGQVGVISEPGKGSVFFFTIPLLDRT